MLVRQEPEKGLLPAQRLGPLSDAFSLADFEAPLRSLWGRSFPAVEVREDNDNYYVVAELPGIAPNDVEVTVEGEVLTIAGRREAEASGSEADLRFSERLSGSFMRRLTLPNLSTGEVAEARMENGLLTITVQKAEEGRRKRIAVQAH